jgi:hypothetical protein
VYAAYKEQFQRRGENFGGQTLDTLAIENYISVKETDGPKFALAIEAASARLRRGHHEPAARQKLVLNTGPKNADRSAAGERRAAEKQVGGDLARGVRNIACL